MKKYLPICLILIFSIVFLGLSKNENKTLKENSKKDTKDIIIASYVNGVYTDELPTESKYFGYVKCFDNSGNEIDSLGFVTWENNKWNVKVTDISASGTCNVYFIDPPAHWLDAESGTLLKAIKDNNAVENVRSIPGKQINKEDEAVLSGTLDDYGTSYFFRGNVKNNYVQFAGKCWQIVRVTGDGSIKLTLYNYNSTDCTATGETLAYARYDGTNYGTYYSSVAKGEQYNAHIGFMYGTPGSTTYEKEHENLHDNTILTNLKAWYDLSGTFTDNEKEALADVIWCGDKRVVTDSNYNPSGYDNLTNSGIGREATYYMGSYRFANGIPSLECGTSINDNKISKYTAYDTTYGNGALNGYKIGLLTSDELMYSGMIYNASSGYLTKNVIYRNSTKANNYVVGYRTMTPATFSNRVNAVTIESYYYSVNSEYDIHGLYGINGSTPDNKMGLRPAIALNYNVQATYNASSEYEPGTVNNPYVISV